MNNGTDKPCHTVDADDRGLFGSGFWRELWDYREAFAMLAWRSVKVRYKQTAIGVAWVAMRPLLLMAVLTLVFGVLAGMKPDGQVPYPLLVLAAVIAWHFFAAVTLEASNSLVGNANIIGKVYFPRVLFPASTLVAALVDLGISLLLFGLLMVWYAYVPGWQLLVLPLFLLLASLLAFGLGIWLAALNVRYRDFAILTPFLLQLGFFLSPVGYVSTVVPAALHWIYDINPMVGVLEGFRWSLLAGGDALRWSAVAWSGAFGLLLTLSGLAYFRRAERSFTDVI